LQNVKLLLLIKIVLTISYRYIYGLDREIPHIYLICCEAQVQIHYSCPNCNRYVVGAQ